MGRMVVLMAWVMAGCRVGWLEGDTAGCLVGWLKGGMKMAQMHKMMVELMAVVVAHAMWLKRVMMAPRTVVTKMAVVMMMVTTRNLPRRNPGMMQSMKLWWDVMLVVCCH